MEFKLLKACRLKSSYIEDMLEIFIGTTQQLTQSFYIDVLTKYLCNSQGVADVINNQPFVDKGKTKWY